MPDRQQVNRGFGIQCRVEQQVVAVNVLAQCGWRADRPGGQLRKRFGGLRRMVEVTPADSRELAEVGNDRCAQFCRQGVEAKLASACNRKASMAPRRARKLAVSSTR